MDDYKLKLNESVAARLSAAPQSADKDELIEELSDNLYRRFLEMTGAGVPDEEAFQRALDDLGDVDELLAYLGVEPGADVTIDREEGQTRITTKDGQRIVINGADDENIIINTGSAGEPEASDTETEAEAAPEGRRDEHGGTHYDYGRGGQQAQSESDLDAILANVSEICRIAVDQARDAVKQAKEAVKRRTSWEKDDGRVKVHFDAAPDIPTPPEPPEAPEAPEAPRPEGWAFEAELDSDEGRFFAGGGPKERKDVVYGFGYDKARGGFYAQWGEWKGDSHTDHTSPHFTGEDSAMRHNDDGSYSVTALKDLRGIEVHTVAGDVTIHVSEAPNAGVIIDGDVDDLDVTCSADGVLTIREGRTASSSFFSRRGIGSADVELYLPRRHWEMLSVTTTSGDIDIDRDGLDIGHLTITTASGDTCARLRTCKVLSFRSASGDLDLSGACTDLLAETASGDITLQGQVEDAQIKTASGDVELEGVTARFHVKSMSGDIRLETSVLPEAMELSSKSGDCEAQIPDAGPFTAHMMTTSGEIDCAFPMNCMGGTFIYGDGSGPCYSLATISGDVTLERY